MKRERETVGQWGREREWDKMMMMTIYFDCWYPRWCYRMNVVATVEFNDSTRTCWIESLGLVRQQQVIHIESARGKKYFPISILFFPLVLCVQKHKQPWELKQQARSSKSQYDGDTESIHLHWCKIHKYTHHLRISSIASLCREKHFFFGILKVCGKIFLLLLIANFPLQKIDDVMIRMHTESLLYY